ncbi:hypothetical protein ACWD25_05130 [Streptomyces sp. NPDC002920]
MTIRLFRAGPGVRRKRVLTPVLALAILVGSLFAFVATTGTQRASAAVDDYKPVTYNMQGGGNKWTTDLPQLMNSGYNVIALQEAGPRPPASAGNPVWTSRALSGNQQWAGWRVQQYRWRPQGSNGSTWNIFWLRTDFSNSSRVNLAILTTHDFTSVLVAAPAFYGNNGLPTSRPALGVRFGDTIFYSVHALSGGGNDGARLLQNMAAQAGTRIWAAMGDWNRVPARLEVRPGWHRYTSNGPTHQGGNELDYMVSNQRIPGYGGVARGMSSDHQAVMFRRLAANAGVQLLNDHDGNRALEVESRNASTNGSSIVTFDTTPGPYGHFKFVPAGNGNYTIRVVKRPPGTNEMCLDASDLRLRRYPCNDTESQLFDMQYWNDTGQIKIMSVYRETCLGDDTDFGYATEIVTTMRCGAGEARFNFRFDNDPGANAPNVVF